MRSTVAWMTCSMVLAAPVCAQAQDRPEDAEFPEGIADEEAEAEPSLSKSISIKLEAPGGALEHGVSTFLRYEAKDQAGEPVQVSGFVVDEKGGEVATFVSDRRGRGSFELIPLRGASYSFKVVRPAVSSAATFSLEVQPPGPKAKPDRPTLADIRAYNEHRRKESQETALLVLQVVVAVVFLPLALVGGLGGVGGGVH